jgi:hypothetical protein
MKIRKNIILILKESFKWRNRDLLEKKNNDPPQLTFKNILKSNIYYIIFAIIISLFVNNLFKDEKISTFLITLFSILICFIVPALTLIFDKFLGRNIENKENRISNKDEFTRTKNFSRKFIFILLESLLICFTLIVLLLLIVMFNDFFIIDIMKYRFVTISKYSILIGVKNFFIITFKIIIITLVIRLFVFIFYLLGALGEYMKGVLDGKTKL